MAQQNSRPKCGAPKGNTNAIRHGLYSPRLPGLPYPDKMAAQFRREVEGLVLEAKGEISVLDAALIHSATEAQRLAYRNRYRARELEQARELTPDLFLRFDDAYRKCLDARDAKLKALGLDQADQEPLTVFCTPEVEDEPEDAAEGRSEAQE